MASCQWLGPPPTSPTHLILSLLGRNQSLLLSICRSMLKKWVRMLGSRSFWKLTRFCTCGLWTQNEYKSQWLKPKLRSLCKFRLHALLHHTDGDQLVCNQIITQPLYQTISLNNSAPNYFTTIVLCDNCGRIRRCPITVTQTHRIQIINYLPTHSLSYPHSNLNFPFPIYNYFIIHFHYTRLW